MAHPTALHGISTKQSLVAAYLMLHLACAVKTDSLIITYMTHRLYQYVGPAEIRAAALLECRGARVRSVDELRRWLAASTSERTTQRTWVATFTIGADGDLYLAPRRSEHVACAAGGPVFSAGEITIDDDFVVTEITNLSTGFCPEPQSWLRVATALDRIGVAQPGRFTTELVFRLCPACGQRNIVKDAWFYCSVCDGELPTEWNFPIGLQVDSGAA